MSEKKEKKLTPLAIARKNTSKSVDFNDLYIKPKKEVVKPINVNDEFESIDMDDIIVESNVRSKFDDESLNELAESIKIYGVLQPIRVYQDGEKYVIIFGHRRYYASKKAGKKYIKAVITAKPDTIDNIIIQIAENEHNEKLPSADIEKFIKILKDEYNLTTKDIAQKMGKSERQVQYYLKASEIRPIHEEKFINSGITLTTSDIINMKDFDDNIIDDTIDKVTYSPEEKVKIIKEQKMKIKDKSNIEKRIQLNIDIKLNDENKTACFTSKIKGFEFQKDLSTIIISSLEKEFVESGYKIKNID